MRDYTQINFNDMSFKVVIKELQKSVRHYDNEANRVLELNQNEYEYNRNMLMRDKFADAIKILTDADGTGENNCNLANVSGSALADAYHGGWRRSKKHAKETNFHGLNREEIKKHFDKWYEEHYR